MLAGLLGASIDMASSVSTGSSSTGSSVGGNISSSTTNVGGNMAGIESVANNIIDSQISAIFMTVMLGVLLVALIYAIAMMVIGGATTLGYAKYNLNLVDDKDPRVGDLFSQYSRLGTGFGMQFFRGLFVFLWSLLFVIPGLIARYRYYMTPFILCENLDMTAREAIRESKQLMKGNKWRMFCLELSFIGWELLIGAVMLICITIIIGPLVFAMNTGSYEAGGIAVFLIIPAILVMGVAGLVSSLVLSPYITASKAVFYREISEGRYSNPHVEGEVEEYMAEKL